MPILDEKMGLTPERAKQVWHDFRSTCWSKSQVYCLKCKSRDYYELGNKKYRCKNKKCRHTFHDFSGRWINKVNFNLHQWGGVISCFCYNITALHTANKFKFSYPTTLKAFTVIRLAIAQQSPDWNLLKENIDVNSILTTNQFKSTASKDFKKILIFGVIESNNKTSTTLLSDLSVKTLIDSKIKIYRSDCIFYTDKYKKYDYLLFYVSKNHKIIIRDNIASINTRQIKNDAFQNYLFKNLNKFCGVSVDKFPLYLKEMEFKYNHRPSLNDYFKEWEEQRVESFKTLISHLTNFIDQLKPLKILKNG